MGESMIARREFLVGAAQLGLMMAGGASFPRTSSGAENTWERIRREKAIRAGFSNDVPFAFMGKDGNLTGSDPETLRAIMAEYGVDKIEGVLVDFAGLIPGLLAGRFDVISGVMAIRPQRCQQIAFSEPNTPLVAAIVVPKGNPLKLHSFEDVVANPTARVGTLTGSNNVDYWLKFYKLPPSRLTTFPEVSQGIAALRAGRVDAYSSQTVNLEPFVKRNPDIERPAPFRQPVDPTGKPLVGLAADGFRKDDHDLLQAYNAGLGKLKASGRLMEILNRFDFGVTPQDMEYLNAKTTELCVQA